MASINDVCDYIITKAADDSLGLSVLKIQKLLYYAQAWHLAFDRGPLFDGKFQAWVHGPVNRSIYNRFRSEKYIYSPVSHTDILPTFSFEKLTPEERAHIDNVLNVYGQFSGDQLESLTHQEIPWIEARGGIPLHERSENLLDEQTMLEFYKARLAKK